MQHNTLSIEFPQASIPFLVLEDDSAFELDQNNPFFFGAMGDCHIQRALPGIDNVHFIIKKEEDNWVLLDMSKGRTKVNRDVINEVAYINNGDVIETKWSSFVFMDIRQ